MNRLPYSRLSEFYDNGWGDFAESSQRFVATTLDKYGVRGGKILEVACGTGILAIHLARAGYTVLGIDRSPEMVALAAVKGQDVDGVEFRVADMRVLKLKTQFDAALCMFDSINYLTELCDVEAMVASIASILNHRGIFIFDFNCPIIYSAYDGETVKRRVKEGILLQELTYDESRRLAQTVFRFPNGDVETHMQRAYELDEIEPILMAAGLRINACFSDFGRRAKSSVSERLICVCQKV